MQGEQKRLKPLADRRRVVSHCIKMFVIKVEPKIMEDDLGKRMIRCMVGQERFEKLSAD